MITPTGRIFTTDTVTGAERELGSNPNLTYSLIKDILIGLEELDHDDSLEYEFG